jgi:lactoylglutathione lyase
MAKCTWKCSRFWCCPIKSRVPIAPIYPCPEAGGATPFSFSRHQLIVYRYCVNVERAKYVVWAAEMPRAVSFYQTAFNASVLRQSEVLSELEIAGATIGIHAGGEGGRTWTGLSFQVADVVAGAREVVAAGGQLLREPMSDAAGDPPHLAMCADTEGNEFMLTRKRH